MKVIHLQDRRRDPHGLLEAVSVSGDGWAKTENPDYKAEYEASARPWRVIHTIWVRYSPGPTRGYPTTRAELKAWADLSARESHNQSLSDRGAKFGTFAVAKVYDPRFDEWAFRRLARESIHSAEWKFMKPEPIPTQFGSLADAKRGWGEQLRPSWGSTDDEAWLRRRRNEHIWVLAVEDES